MPESRAVLSFKGTPGYMAPEVYRRRLTDTRSDIYSLGVVLYQCLNDNRLPFVPENFSPEDIDAAIEKRLSGEQIPDPAHGSRGLKEVVLKAIAERPEDRYQSAVEMYRALEEVYKAEYKWESKGEESPGSRSGREIQTVEGNEGGLCISETKIYVGTAFST